jgi:MYXO-CTERM domain-containing protein
VLSTRFFARVSGIDDVDWIRQYDSSASIMNLATDSMDADADSDLSAPATPVPATALLILSGLLVLRYRRRA